MTYPALNSPANLLAWARQLMLSLTQRDAGWANLPTYASDAAAGAGGLTTGQFYKTSDGASGFYVKVKS